MISCHGFQILHKKRKHLFAYSPVSRIYGVYTAACLLQDFTVLIDIRKLEFQISALPYAKQVARTAQAQVFPGNKKTVVRLG